MEDLLRIGIILKPFYIYDMIDDLTSHFKRGLVGYAEEIIESWE